MLSADLIYETLLLSSKSTLNRLNWKPPRSFYGNWMNLHQRTVKSPVIPMNICLSLYDSEKPNIKRTYEEIYHDEVLIMVRVFHDDVLRFETQVKDGHDRQKHGTLNSFYPNGNVEEERNYENDWLHGPQTSYYPSGRKWCLDHYQHGFQHGRSIFWRDTEHHRLAYMMEYEHDELKGIPMFWDEDGNRVEN